MATIQSIADDVYTITNRPDLVTETTVAIRKAIRKFHGADTFKRDLNSVQLRMADLATTDPNQYRWAIPLDTFPRFRRFDTVAYPMNRVMPTNQIPAPLVDVAQGFGPKRQFVELGANNLFDGYGYEKQNYYFITGNTVNVKSGWYIDYLSFTYYQWPTIPQSTSAELDSWIAREYPDAIIEEASGAVFKMIGKDDEYQRFSTLFAENLAIVKATDIGNAQ